MPESSSTPAPSKYACRVNRLRRGGSEYGLLLFLLVGAIAAAATHHFIIASMAAVAFVHRLRLTKWLAASVWRQKRWAEANENGLSLDGRRVLARSQIGAAYYFPPKRTVRFLTNDALARRVEIEVENEADGRSLLSSMRLDTTQMAARYDLRVTDLLVWAGGVPFTLAWMAEASWRWAALFVAVALVRRVLFGSMVRIGNDGVWLESYAGKRFVRFEDVGEIAVRNDDAIVLVLRTGARPLDVVRVGWTVRRGVCLNVSCADDAKALAARIWTALQAFRARSATLDPAASFDGGTAAEWQAHFRALLHAPAGYRSPVVPAEEVYRVAEDPAAEPAKRIGAAGALRESIDDEGRARLRVAAEASATPEVRAALAAEAEAEADAHTALAIAR